MSKRIRKRRSKHRPKLSLCMIARDEERFLAECLRSAAGIADEIVVVDTGSRDATISIARGFGARVVEHPWRDDFADARNRAVAEASGDFMLTLDADERLDPKTSGLIRDAVVEGGWDLGLLPFVNVGDGGGELGRWEAPRLHRITPGLRWIGRVHEQVLQNLPNVRQRRIAATVSHYGYQSDVFASKEKAARNERLIDKALDDPEAADPVLRSNYLYHRASLARGSELLERFEHFERYVNQQWSDDPPRLPWITAGRTEYCRLLNDVGRHAEAEALAGRLIGRHGASPLLLYVQARTRAFAGDLSAARALVEKILRPNAPIGDDHRLYNIDARLIQSRARFLLGLILESEGAVDQALEHYRAAHDEEPEQDAFLRALICAQVRLGRRREAAAVLQSAGTGARSDQPALDCLALALAVCDQSLGGLAFWGQKVRTAAPRFGPAKRMLQRLEELGANRSYSMEDFPEIEQALLMNDPPGKFPMPQTGRKNSVMPVSI